MSHCHVLHPFLFEEITFFSTGFFKDVETEIGELEVNFMDVVQDLATKT